MARYFFHIFADDHLMDNFGTECTDAQAIRLHMLALAQAACRVAKMQSQIWSIEVVDESGSIVASMDLLNSLAILSPPV